jgi:hypothetical protein
MEAKIDLVKGFPEDLYRERYAKVKSTQICMRCGEPVRENNSPSSKLEYRVFSMRGMPQ